jgi:hypothetical protein
MGVMRRWLSPVLLVLALSVAGAACKPGSAGQATGTTSVISVANTVDLSCAQPGVQLANCGVKPTQAGDRGGALQYTVWALLVAGLVVIFTVVFRSAARTNRAKRAEVGDKSWS